MASTALSVRSPYKYEPLDHGEDEIRLLQIDLNARKHEYEIKSNVSLRKSKPQYWALSYFWGEYPKEEWTKLVNGIEPDYDQLLKIHEIKVNGRVAPVSDNLYRALERVRAHLTEHYGTSRRQVLLWCDQYVRSVH